MRPWRRLHSWSSIDQNHCAKVPGSQGKRSLMVSLLIAVLVVASVDHQAIGRAVVVGERNDVGSDLEASTMGRRATSDATRDRINLFLDDLATNSCGAGRSLVEKIDKAASTLAALRNFIRTSRSHNPNPGEQDMIFLGSVEDNIDEGEWLPGGKLASKLVLQFEMDLAEQFSAHYARYHQIGDDGSWVWRICVMAGPGKNIPAFPVFEFPRYTDRDATCPNRHRGGRSGPRPPAANYSPTISRLKGGGAGGCGGFQPAAEANSRQG